MQFPDTFYRKMKSACIEDGIQKINKRHFIKYIKLNQAKQNCIAYESKLMAVIPTIFFKSQGTTFDKKSLKLLAKQLKHKCEALNNTFSKVCLK